MIWQLYVFSTLAFAYWWFYNAGEWIRVELESREGHHNG